MKRENLINKVLGQIDNRAWDQVESQVEGQMANLVADQTWSCADDQMWSLLWSRIRNEAVRQVAQVRSQVRVNL
jgi:hypothetical protein